MTSGPTRWLPIGEEPRLAGNISDCIVQRRAGISAVSLLSGDIDATEHSSTGLYQADTRYLSLLRFEIEGIPLSRVDATQTGSLFRAVFTNPELATAAGQVVPSSSIHVRRERVLDEALVERITISNHSRHSLTLRARFRLAADFLDIFEVRGVRRIAAPPSPSISMQSNGARWEAAGSDGVLRSLHVSFEPPPDEASSPDSLSFLLRLEPQATSRIEMRARPSFQPVARSFQSSLERVAAAERAFLARTATIETSSDVLNTACRRALLDIHHLETTHDGQTFVAAGVPWFDTLFGRDSLLTGILLAPICPSVLENALRALAEYQAQDTDESRDAEPGKIPHELRWGELARTGEVPFGQYYGSVDATPLFIIGAREYLAWSGDVDLVDRLWSSLTRALSWCLDSLDERGFISYSRRSAVGLENQGWKDSHDSVVNPHGRKATPPVALVEVQAYLIAAMRSFAELCRRSGREVPRRLESQCQELVERFEAAFRVAGLGYALCLDGAGVQFATRCSNAGHALWAGAASQSASEDVATTLSRPDLFSGWGVRTLSKDSPVYNPLGYHTGTVWPHDNALIVAGLRRYGHDAAARRIADAVLDAAVALSPDRMPELLSGDNRELDAPPMAFPVASRPQAWAAASVPATILALLGVQPGVGEVVVCRPMLPSAVEWLHLRNLQCGEGKVDLSFRQLQDRVLVEITNLRGNGRVSLAEHRP